MTAVAYLFPTAPGRSGRIAATPDSASAPTLMLVPPPPAMQQVYLRRRVVAAVLALATVAVLVLAAQAAVSAVIDSSSAPVLVADVSTPGPTTWEVKSGDTLWSIASATHPGEDPRPVVAAMKASGVPSNLQIGDQLP